jgi:hypothetical protein
MVSEDAGGVSPSGPVPLLPTSVNRSSLHAPGKLGIEAIAQAVADRIDG